jgi:hypothetical protein
MAIMLRSVASCKLGAEVDVELTPDALLSELESHEESVIPKKTESKTGLKVLIPLFIFIFIFITIS